MKKRITALSCVIAAVCLLLSSCGLLSGISAITAPFETAEPVSSGEAAALIPFYAQRYYLSSLSDFDRALVCGVYKSIMNFDTEYEIKGAVSVDKLVSVLHLIQCECPELFQVDYYTAFSYEYDANTKIAKKLKTEYRTDAATYAKYRAECEDYISGAAKTLEGLDAFGREAEIFKIIAESCGYDADGALADTVYGALIEKKAKCDGISRAFKWMCEYSGVECLYITADSNSGDVGHAWNMVKLDGGYYNVDLTQSVRADESGAEAAQALSGLVMYYCFNVPDKWMSERYTVHGYLDGFRPKPVCASFDQSYYARRGTFVYAGADPYLFVYGRLEDITDEGGGHLVIQFEEQSDMNSFLDGLSANLTEWIGKTGNGAASVSCTVCSHRVCVINVSV